MTDQNMEGMEEVKSARVTFGKVGDFIKGTLVDIREIDNQYGKIPGEKSKIYEILAEVGSFHTINELKEVATTPIVINKGEFYNVFGKAGIDVGMRNIKKGQIVGLRFTEQKPSKTPGFNPTKVIKVFAGAMDPEYQGQTAADVEQKEW